MLEKVWPGVFVGDAVLKVAVRDIRKALGDDAHAPHYIETAHRRCRFAPAFTSANSIPRRLKARWWEPAVTSQR